ncbi:Uma2 family endonuclease [Candidatus Poribacteria bacterium]|nr:Uma2 family endonuclease [Candidatus Poribacteria bacterium]
MVMMAKLKSPEIRSLPTDGEVYYPESDGKPMAETDVHFDLMTDIVKTLQVHFQNRSDVYVSGNSLLYYEQGNPKKSVAPDVFVVFGVEKKRRNNYLLWKEGKGPDFVLELSSKKTYRTDLNQKKTLYGQVLEVSEYFLYDPNHQYLNPPLQGYRLMEGGYVEILPVGVRLPSRVLGLELGLKPDGELGLYTPQTNIWLLSPRERAEQAEAKAEQAEAKAEQAEAKAEQAEAKVEQAEARAEHAQAKAQQETEARQRAEVELAQVRAELQRFKRQYQHH